MGTIVGRRTAVYEDGWADIRTCLSRRQLRNRQYTGWSSASGKESRRRSCEKGRQVNASQVSNVSWNRPAPGSRCAGLGAPRVFGGIRCEQTAHVERNSHEVGNDQSSLVVPYRCER